MTQFRSLNLSPPTPPPTMTAYKRTEASQLFKMQMQLLMLSLQHWTPLETQIESNMRILYNWMRRNPDDMYRVYTKEWCGFNGE